MRVVLTGSSGFIGSSLKIFLEEQGHVVECLHHGTPWDSSNFEGCDAVIHLAGASIAEGRWTAKRKRALVSSRIVPTTMLAQILSQLSHPPKVLISASAIGFYGNRHGEVLTERSGAGKDFLATLCQSWEKAARPVGKHGIRLVHPRFGIILSPKGGILQKLLPLFRCGLGGPLGSGNQIISWISLNDALRGIAFCLDHPSLTGPVNFVAPHPVSQREFTKLLAKKLHRFAFLRTPAWLLRLVVGEMADGLLLSSQHALPEKLLSAGFVFHQTHLESFTEKM